METKAVVLAAGEGTRLRPLTFTRPKPMIPVGPQPSIFHLLSHLSREGFDEILMVVRGSLRNAIMGYLGDGSKLGLRITYELEPDGLRIGTAGSLRLCEHLLDETFLVAQADTLTEIPLGEAVDFHHDSGALATIVLTRVQDPSDYGVALLDKDDVITEFQEKPGKEEAKSNLVSTGFYIMEPESLDCIMDNEWDFAKNLFPWLLKRRKKLSGFASDAFWVDMGSLEGYLRGVQWVVERMARPQDAGATQLRNPVTTDWKGRMGYGARNNCPVLIERETPIEARAKIGPSSALMSNARFSSAGLLGRSLVIEGASIGHSAQITPPVLIERETAIDDGAKIGKFCVIMRNAHVSSGTVLDRSVVMERASIGRNCTIVDSVIGESAIIQGNVAISGSIIGPGCVIGDRVNVLNGSKVWPNVQIRADERVKGIVAAPLERAFYFYTAPGKYTGLLATTIEGFIEALEKSPIESIEFHVKRRDYERWAREVLALDELADGIEDLRKMAVAGEGLRHDLVGVTKKWADAIENS